MFVLIPITAIVLGGAIGGVINALLTDNGFIKPRDETIDNVTIIRPGFVGNVVMGATAAFVSWGLYGTFSGAIIFSTYDEPVKVAVSLSTIAAAVLMGMVGANWLTNQVDKKLLKTALTASTARSDRDDSQKISMATPAQAFNIVKGRYGLQ